MTISDTGRRGRLFGGAALASLLAVGAFASPALAQVVNTARPLQPVPRPPDYSSTQLSPSQTPPPAPAEPSSSTAGPTSDQVSQNLTVNLMHLLVKQGVISKVAADGLMAEAERETAQARATAAPASAAPPAALASNLPPPAPGATRIPYVPEIVRDQIRDEVRTEVLAQAKAENWAQPNQIPPWTQRVTISGDVRLRYESDLYSRGNDPNIINFAALNANGPIDINPTTNLSGVPLLNTTRDRPDQLVIRARLDIAAKPSDWVTADIRLASGTTNSPVSTSQLLGGGLTKKNIWLDRAYIDLHPAPWIGGSFGRMPNPFFSTDLVYDYDLNFDGAAARGQFDVLPDRGVSLFGTAGAFLTEYSDSNFPDNSSQKSGYKAKWMIGSQVGADWKTQLFDWRTALAYYSFQRTEGLLSQPCAVYAGVTQCSTDYTRPAFMQKGNTLFLIRNIEAPPNAASGSYAVPEYAGLLFPFHVLNLTSTLTVPLFTGKPLELTGDYARNLAYSFKGVCRYGSAGLPVNNIPAGGDNQLLCANPASPTAGNFKSGPNAWMLRASYGDPDPNDLGQWNFTVGYKHIAADSVLDAYTDADFHYGGTNAKGYFLMATFGLLYGSNLQLRWFSANEVSGPPLSIDVGQIDLNARF